MQLPRVLLCGVNHDLTSLSSLNSLSLSWKIANIYLCLCIYIYVYIPVEQLSLWYVVIRREEKLHFLKFSLQQATKMYIWRYSASSRSKVSFFFFFTKFSSPPWVSFKVPFEGFICIIIGVGESKYTIFFQIMQWLITARLSLSFIFWFT